MRNLIDFFVNLGGIFVATSVTVILRQTFQLTRKSWKVRVSEALLCSMLSCALTQVISYLTDIPTEMSYAISVFCGFLGVDFIRALVVSVLKLRLPDIEDSQNKKE